MGLPSVEQVSEHESRGGLWLLRFADGIPAYRRLQLSNLPGEITGFWSDDRSAIDFIPCDQEGNPMPLVVDCDGWKKTADDHYRMHRHASQELKRERARADKAEQERDAERARANTAEANYRWMVKREAERKLDGYRELGDKAAAAENERDYYRDLASKLESQRDEYRRQRDELQQQLYDLANQPAALQQKLCNDR